MRCTDSHRAGAGYAYFCVLAGVFVTALYTFRMFFMTFHGQRAHGRGHAASICTRVPGW